MRALRYLLAVILVLFLTACATTPQAPQAPQAPTWTELYLYTSYAARRGIY